MHAEADRLLADDAADIAGSDDAERLAGDLDAHEFRLLPLAGLGRGVGGGKLAGNREHQRNGMFGRRDRVAERRVHDDDAAARSGRDIDIVDADAGAADDLEAGCRSDQLFRRLGRGTDGETVVIADALAELFFVLDGLSPQNDLDAALDTDPDRYGRR